jgi:hypothetical protein
MSLSGFLVSIAMYVLIFGVVTGGLAAWMTRSGSSPLGEMITAFRTRAGTRKGSSPVASHSRG